MKKLEEKADKLMSKDRFQSVDEAIQLYLKAHDILAENTNESKDSNVYSTTVFENRVMNDRLLRKIDDAISRMASFGPKR